MIYQFVSDPMPIAECDTKPKKIDGNNSFLTRFAVPLFFLLEP
jgi:hypothetical protein